MNKMTRYLNNIGSHRGLGLGWKVSSKKSCNFKFLLLLCVIAASGAHAALDSAINVVKLNAILRDIAAIREALHYKDEGRVLVIEDSVKKLKGAMENESGSIFEVTRGLQLFFGKMSVSKPFFEFIRTQRTQLAIRELLATYQEIRKTTAYDAGPVSKDIFAHFEELQIVVKRFRDSDKIRPKLRDSLTRLYRFLTDAKAAAWENGDAHEITKDFVRQVNKTVGGLYNELLSYIGTQPLDEFAQEIVGTNEILGSLLVRTPEAVTQ
jgi:hypothetical protein